MGLWSLCTTYHRINISLLDNNTPMSCGHFGWFHHKSRPLDKYSLFTALLAGEAFLTMLAKVCGGRGLENTSTVDSGGVNQRCLIVEAVVGKLLYMPSERTHVLSSPFFSQHKAFYLIPSAQADRSNTTFTECSTWQSWLRICDLALSNLRDTVNVPDCSRGRHST